MSSDTASPHRDATPRGGRDSAPCTQVDGAMTVMLFEDAAGRLVVVDAARGVAPEHEAPLLRIGRARIVLRHLGALVTTRLLAEGCVAVEGADALNVLLAFADEVGRTS